MSQREDGGAGSGTPISFDATPRVGPGEHPWGCLRRPLLPDVGVIAVVPDQWNGVWQSRHYVLTRLARYFHIVWCCPSAGDRRHGPGGDGRSGRNNFTPTDRPPGLMIHDRPSWIPDLHRPAALARLTTRERFRGAQRLLAQRGCDRVVLSLWRPSDAAALESIPHSVSCYHIDDEYTFSEVEQATSEDEAHLIRKVDQVFISSRGLFEKKGHLNPNTLFVPNGVDYAAYIHPWPEPEDLRAIPHPRIGYVGLIKKQLNLQLLDALARRHPTWSFVFVGPRRHEDEVGTLIQRLADLPNVHFLGEKPVSELPSYTQHIDVCTLCYKVDDYTKFIYPLKLHESLASGQPGVGAPIRTLRDFAAVLDLADSVEEWSEAIAAMLGPAARSEARTAARRAVAREHDWDRLVYHVAAALGDRLGASYRQRVQQGMPSSQPLAREA
jgi:glycosyltransferase involved in cell wall biosynthesis